ncbi:hypothetical protein EHP00_2462 [Ecytonucleospora hepatopenaei]|uniref:Uncharacterized protein n=1 Tax=Ecytonucleospora hepatopenaei TaxID=646526 RepID=A0A1W0E6V4_9MICR|nr:hypothetical protein EHP00_2462 [Ecytonucleospora hepatopenaei]
MFFSHIIYNAIIIKKEIDFNLTYSHLHNSVEEEINNTTETVLDNDDDEYFKDMEDVFKTYKKKNIDFLFIHNIFSKIWSGLAHYEYTMNIKNIFLMSKKT